MSDNSSVTVIVATDEALGIGKNNTLPWHCPEDMKYFFRYTVGKTVIMGRKTYESIGFVLADRINIIVSASKNLEVQNSSSVAVFETFREALFYAKLQNREVVIAGGQMIYEQALPIANKVIHCQIKGKYDCDAWFPMHQMNDRPWAGTTEDLKKYFSEDEISHSLLQSIDIYHELVR